MRINQFVSIIQEIKMNLRLLIVGILFYYIEITSSSKILFLLPIASKSHYNVFEPLLKELAKNNHEIVLMAPFEPATLPPNVESVMPVTIEQIWGKMPTAFELRKMSPIQVMLSSTEWFDEACHEIYKHERVKELLKNTKFDLIFIDIFLNYCAGGMLDHFKAPYIYVSTAPANNDLSAPIGSYFPPSFVPCPFLPYSDRMTFSERFGNTVLQWMFTLIEKVTFVPNTEAIYRKYLGENTRSLSEIHSNTTMMFMNSHFTLTYARPLLPDIIEVGGMHCRPAQSLPKDLEEFVSGSGKDGFIVFSLGSIAQGTDMPEETRKSFLNVFSKLKQRVIWKWETEKMDEDIPPNVILKKFIPQQDLLGHPKIRAFMTHGGLLSIQESVYHGVPLITLPLFADQDLNAIKAEKAGFALTIEIDNFDEKVLEEKLSQILENPKFSERAKQLSILTRDQPETPLERAVYWSEYVIRHKGAFHMRSAARDLNVFQFHSLDVIAMLITILLIVLTFVVTLLKKIVSCFFRDSAKNKQHHINSKKQR